MSDAPLAAVTALADPQERPAAAQRLAALLAAETVLLLVRDPQLGVLLPAAGMPQTLRGGGHWRAFLQTCGQGDGRHVGEVDLPEGVARRALALVGHGVAVVIVGGTPQRRMLERLETLLPLLGRLLSAEQEALVARAEAEQAREMAQRAQALAQALDAARAEGARLNARLREEHVRKDEFLAMLAHELRNPLAPIVTSVEVLKHPGLEANRLRRQVEVIERQAGQLSHLVEDLLDVSRVSRGRIELRCQRLDLREVLRTAVEDNRELLGLRGHTLELALPAHALPLQGDPVRLIQVFSNLLRNAAKYTPAAGRLSLGAAIEGGWAVVRVQDNGVGIAPDMLPRVFDLFVQAPTSMDRAQGGLGIGLTLVRLLTQLHGGEVRADSAGPGQGSCFTVRLPLAAEAHSATPPLSSVPAAASATAGAVSAGEAAPPLRILVVDDNRDAADALAQMLQFDGHQVSVAYAGPGALQRAEDLDAQLVLLDLGLPGLDGYEVARRLRRRGGCRPYIVALSGYGTQRDRERSREAGIDEHRVKPLSGADLQTLVREVARSFAPLGAREPPRHPLAPVPGQAF